MTYTVTGTLADQTYSVTYTKLSLLKARLTCKNTLIVDIITTEAEMGGLKGPVGMILKQPYLNDPLAALFVMMEVFDEILETTGDVPTAPSVPDGAIG